MDIDHDMHEAARDFVTHAMTCTDCGIRCRDLVSPARCREGDRLMAAYVATVDAMRDCGPAQIDA